MSQSDGFESPKNTHSQDELQSDEENHCITGSSDSNEITSKEHTAPEKEPLDGIVVPEGGYGWFVVAAIFLFNFSTWGANSGFAIYLAHYLTTDTFHGASQYDYSFIGGLAIGLGLMSAPFINYFVGLIGTRPVIILGSIFQLAAMLLASFSTKLWQLYLTQGVLESFGLAFIAIPGLTLLPQWFRKKRTLVQGLAAAGSGGGGILFNLAMEKIMLSVSFRWALRTQAIICFALTLVGVLLTRTRNRHVKPEFNLYDLLVLKSFGFWVETLWLIFTMFGYVVLLYNLADFTISLGYSSHQGSVVAAMISVGVLFGRPAVGILSDKYGVVTVSCIVHLIVSIFCFAMWIPTRNYATAIAFALIQGSMMGTVWPVVSSITARIVGLRKLNVTFSMLWIFLGGSSMVSPVIGIALKSSSTKTVDPTQYLDVSIFVGFCYFGAAICLFILRGWLIVRDHLSIADAKDGISKESDDGGELALVVHWKDWFRYAFSTKKIKNI